MLKVQVGAAADGESRTLLKPLGSPNASARNDLPLPSLSLYNRRPMPPGCKRICKPDVAGRPETGETRRVREDRMPQIFRGQRGDQRLYEMSETGVVWLITQRQPALSFASSECIFTALGLALT
jgi:hypothetical protein